MLHKNLEKEQKINSKKKEKKYNKEINEIESRCIIEEIKVRS